MKKFQKKWASKMLTFLLVAAVLQISGCKEIDPEWSMEYATDTVSEFIEAVCVDSYGDIIMAADAYDKSGQEIVEKVSVVKYNDRGTFLWNYLSSGENDRIFKMVTDDYDNIYIAGSAPAGSYVMKLTPGGSLAWEQTALDGDWVTGGLAVFNGIVYMGNQNIYAFDCQTGETLWSVILNLRTTDMVTDSSGNIYVSGYSHIGSFDPEGNNLWLVNTDDDYTAMKLAIDNNDNLFACAGITGTSLVRTFKIETNTGLTLADTTESVDSYWNPQLAVDVQGNVIMAASGENSDLGRRVVKYSSNLSKIWAHTFISGKKHMDIDQMLVEGNGDIYVTGGDATTKISAGGDEITTVTTGTETTNNRIALDSTGNFFYTATEKEYYDNKNLTLSQYKN